MKFMIIHTIVIGLLLPVALRAQSDNFTNGDAAWTHYDPLGTGNWSFPSNTYRIQSATTPNTALGPGRAGSLLTSASYSHFFIQTELVTWDNSLDQLFGVLARVNTPGLGTTAGYALTYGTKDGATANGQLAILRITGEAGTTLTSADIPLSPANHYLLIFCGAGTTFTGQIFDTKDLVHPLGTLRAIDTTYTSGGVGLFGYDNSAGARGTVDVGFDNFVAATPRPALTSTRQTNQALVVDWPSWAGGFRLQSSATVPSATWQNSVATVGEDSNIFSTTNGIGPGNAFFRLVAP